VCGDVTTHTGPDLCMAAYSAGSADASFVVKGTGFGPGAPVTVTLTGLGPANNTILQTTSRVRPVVGQNGTLRFTISQVYPGSLPMGLFTVEVREAGGYRASTEFMVIPPGAPGS
jgi:hypothetical protein